MFLQYTDGYLNSGFSINFRDPENDPLTYDIYLGMNPDDISLVCQDCQESSYIPAGHGWLFEPGITYYWTIVAKDDHGNVATPTVWNFTTTHLPSTPNLLTPGNNSTNASLTLTFVWESSTDPDNDPLIYNLFLGESTQNMVKIAEELDNTSYLVNTLKPSKTYYWKVEVWDNKYASSTSVYWRFSTTHPPSSPTDPYPHDGQTDTPISFTFSWEANDPDGDTITYRLYLGTNTEDLEIKANDLESTSVSISDLAYGTTYYWKVVAVDDKGASSTSDLWSFTTVENSPPNQPSNPNPQDNDTGVPTNPTLSWSCSDPDNDVLHYDVYLGESESNLHKIAEDILETQVSTSGLNYSTWYYWKVVAKDIDTHHDRVLHTTEGPIWSFKTQDPPAGTLFWRTKLGDGCKIVSSPALRNGKVYVGCGNKLYALDQEDGSIVWISTTDQDGKIISTPALGSDGRIYFVNDLGVIYAIKDLGDSAIEEWHSDAGTQVDFVAKSSPAIDNSDGTETVYVVFGTNDGNKLFAFKYNGEQKWSNPPGVGDNRQDDWIRSSPAVGTLDGTTVIYVGSTYDMGLLHAIGINGVEKWVVYLESGESGYTKSSPAIGSDGTIYIGADDGYLYAIDTSDPSNIHIKWKIKLPDDGAIESSPAVGTYCQDTGGGDPGGGEGDPGGGSICNTVIYIGADNGNLYAVLDTYEGPQILWESNLGTVGYPVKSSPAIGNDGKIYVGKDDGWLHAVNPDDGSEVWHFPHSGDDSIKMRSSPAIGIVNGKTIIFVGSDDGYLYAIYADSGGLANEAWPMFRHDNERSGNKNH